MPSEHCRAPHTSNPHLPTQGTENCRVDVARLALPATASVTTSFWRHASDPAVVYQEEETCLTARHQLDTECFNLLATSTMAEFAPHQQFMVRCAVPLSRCAPANMK